MSGTRIGLRLTDESGAKWDLVEFLGAGSFGEVYRGVNSDTGRLCAAKLLPLRGTLAGLDLLAHLNEARLATRVSHPNVVEVFAIGEDDQGGPFMLMEFVQGQTLQTLIDSHASSGAPIPFGPAAEIMIQIAQGARAINTEIVHRDLKPDNILIGAIHVKITDFGVSKLVAESTRSKTFKGGGPVRFMSPEAWKGQKNTVQMDVYSVGIVFHQLLALRHPLLEFINDRSVQEEWRQAHLFSTPKDLQSSRSDIPSPVRQLISRMMDKNPSKRPSWDEVVTVLSESGEEYESDIDIATIVETAVARKSGAEQKRLDQEKRSAEVQEQSRLYEYAFERLIALWDDLVNQFNEQFQGGEIRKSGTDHTVNYDLPYAPRVKFRLFVRAVEDIQIQGKSLVGGVALQIIGRVGANFLLLRETPDDLYGTWVACAVSLSPIVVPASALSHLNSRPTSETFGFDNEADFYEHIRWAGRGSVHIFKYDLRTDVDVFLQEALQAAFS